MERVTQAQIAKDLGVSTFTVSASLKGNPKCGLRPELMKKVQEYSQKVGYKNTKTLSLHHFKDVNDRRQHMQMLRAKGFSNAEIAKLTGYAYKTVLDIIGYQPQNITAASYKKAGEINKIRTAYRREGMKEYDEKCRKIRAYNMKIVRFEKKLETLQAEMRQLDELRKTLPTDTELAIHEPYRSVEL